MSTVMDNNPERIPAAERREQILAAASIVFGERGYAGATTDQVAQAAGISQPYVVRMFGGKENLFIEVVGRSVGRLVEAFRTTLAEHGDDKENFGHHLGAAYVDLIEDRGILLSLMQAFLMGGDPVIGAKSRECFLMIYRLLRDEAGMDAETVRGFLAEGMLINTLFALRISDDYDTDPAAKELIDCAFRAKVGLVLDAGSSAA
jgi:TetR/AcrR family transcriptional regulator